MFYTGTFLKHLISIKKFGQTHIVFGQVHFVVNRYQFAGCTSGTKTLAYLSVLQLINNQSDTLDLLSSWFSIESTSTNTRKLPIQTPYISIHSYHNQIADRTILQHITSNTYSFSNAISNFLDAVSCMCFSFLSSRTCKTCNEQKPNVNRNVTII